MLVSNALKSPQRYVYIQINEKCHQNSSPGTPDDKSLDTTSLYAPVNALVYASIHVLAVTVVLYSSSVFFRSGNQTSRQ